MKRHIPFFKELFAYLAGGFAGGIVYGIFSTHSIAISFIYSIIGAISFSLARIAICYLRKRILKAFTFGIVLGISVSFLSYYLLNPNDSFFHFTVPVTIGFIVGGMLHIYLPSFRSQD